MERKRVFSGNNPGLIGLVDRVHVEGYPANAPSPPWCGGQGNRGLVDLISIIVNEPPVA